MTVQVKGVKMVALRGHYLVLRRDILMELRMDTHSARNLGSY